MKLIYKLSVAGLLLAMSCTETQPKQKVNEAPPTNPSPKIESTSNPINKAMLIGNWRSLVDAKSEIKFSETADTKMLYSMNYEGKKVEEGTWIVPTNCQKCQPEAPDGCFFFKAEDGESCCSIVKVTGDSLQYIVLGSTGKIQSFKRVK
jgi:hypothetical protein